MHLKCYAGIPKFIFNKQHPNLNHIQKMEWDDYTSSINQETLELGFVFQKNDPGIECSLKQEGFSWCYDDIKTLKDFHFRDNSIYSPYITYMILRMVDFQSANKIRGDVDKIASHVETLGETKIPVRTNKGGIMDVPLKDIFEDKGNNIEIKYTAEKIDVGTLFVLGSRYCTEKYFDKLGGINKIWGIMEKLTNLFLKKSILKSSNTHQLYSSLPSDKELAFLMGQYVSVMEYRALLNGSCQQSSDFTGFNTRMYDEMISDLSGIVRQAGDEALSGSEIKKFCKKKFHLKLNEDPQETSRRLKKWFAEGFKKNHCLKVTAHT